MTCKIVIKILWSIGELTNLKQTNYGHNSNSDMKMAEKGQSTVFFMIIKMNK